MGCVSSVRGGQHFITEMKLWKWVKNGWSGGAGTIGRDVINTNGCSSPSGCGKKPPEEQHSPFGPLNVPLCSE